MRWTQTTALPGLKCKPKFFSRCSDQNANFEDMFGDLRGKITTGKSTLWGIYSLKDMTAFDSLILFVSDMILKEN